MIYLDHHSATRPCSSAIDRMMPYLQEYWAASSAPHKMGQDLMAQLDARCQTLYGFAGADPKESFVFTSSGAEAANQVLWSVFLEKARKEGKTQFIASAIEDAPTLQMMKRLEELGCTVKIAPVGQDGRIDAGKLKEMISKRTALISVTMAQGLTGVIQPYEEIIGIAKESGVLVHLDATYAAGKIPLAFTEWGADYLTFSGDRIHALKSSGALFAKAGSPLAPLIVGGGEQAGMRGGAFDIPSFMALCAAAQQAELYLDAMSLEVARLRDKFEELAAPFATPLFQHSLRLPNVSVLVFPKAHQEALLYLMSRKGLCASIGGSYAPHLSRLIEADGERAVSFSLSRMTTEEEIVQAASILKECAESLELVSGGLAP